MEEIDSPPPPPGGGTSSVFEARRKQETSEMSGVKKECLSFGVSLQEFFRYFKASLLRLAKKMTARNEKEAAAAAAELDAEKLQVEAANEAEFIKSKIHKSL